MAVDVNSVAPVRPGLEVAIRVQDLVKRYAGARGVTALDGFGLEVRDKEFVAVLGPSGCGKSTLLRILAGLESGSAGQVSVFGEVVQRPRDDVGVVFQAANLLPWQTVDSNLRLGVEIRRGRRAAQGLDVTDLVETLGLTGFEQAFPHELSGGMRQRVALGQALLLDPRILLLDEPFGALDALTRDRLNVELLRIWQRASKTVVLITHSIAEAVLLADRIVVLSPRPARILEDIRIDLPRPRDPSRTREAPAFGDYVVRISRLMGVQ